MVGRLDTNTSGVLLFTDDSRLLRAIIDPFDTIKNKEIE
jgi:16S rRNA U516 pseudouridylate synthase RsuA-like enzyme